jgi:hypothetical protein
MGCVVYACMVGGNAYFVGRVVGRWNGLLVGCVVGKMRAVCDLSCVGNVRDGWGRGGIGGGGCCLLGVFELCSFLLLCLCLCACLQKKLVTFEYSLVYSGRYN